jgi:hypothetical protein
MDYCEERKGCGYCYICAPIYSPVRVVVEND